NLADEVGKSVMKAIGIRRLHPEPIIDRLFPQILVPAPGRDRAGGTASPVVASKEIGSLDIRPVAIGLEQVVGRKLASPQMKVGMTVGRYEDTVLLAHACASFRA